MRTLKSWAIGLVFLSLVTLPSGCIPIPNTPTTSQAPFCATSLKWVDHTNGAPLKRTSGEALGGGDPFVLFDDGIFKMWRTRFINGVLGTAYAESEDGLQWNPLTDAKGNQRLVLTPTPGSWDARVLKPSPS